MKEAVRQEIVKTCRTGVGNAIQLLQTLTGAPCIAGNLSHRFLGMNSRIWMGLSPLGTLCSLMDVRGGLCWIGVLCYAG